MRTLTRRGWFRRIGGVALGLTLARELPGLAPKPPGLMWRKDAFALVMERRGVGDVIYVRIPTRYQIRLATQNISESRTKP